MAVLGDVLDGRIMAPVTRRGAGHARATAAIALAAVIAAGCRAEPPVESAARKADPQNSPGLLAAGGLVPFDAPVDRLGELPRDPYADSIHPDPRMAERIRRGYDLFRRTPELAPDFGGNDLSCASCHLNGGQRERALPLVGVSGTFPQYRTRDDRLVTLEDRIAGCFKRSMNGTAPPRNHPVSLALAAYIAWLSHGQPTGEKPSWTGLNEIPVEARIPIGELDPAEGERLYIAQCAACHGVDGQGLPLGGALEGFRPGPLWGERSWNDGAGAARVWKLAGYIRWAMPLTDPGSLTDEEAQAIAAWINTQERPAYPTKAADFPAGGRPADAVYDTLVFARHPYRAN
jgi:thiosulfate dehydrogenase